MRRFARNDKLRSNTGYLNNVVNGVFTAFCFVARLKRVPSPRGYKEMLNYSDTSERSPARWRPVVMALALVFVGFCLTRPATAHGQT